MRIFLIRFIIFALFFTQVVAGGTFEPTPVKTIAINAATVINDMKDGAKATLEKVTQSLEAAKTAATKRGAETITSEAKTIAFTEETGALVQAVNQLCEKISVEIIGRIKKIQAASQGELAELEREIEKTKKDLEMKERDAEIVTTNAINEVLSKLIKAQVKEVRDSLGGYSTTLTNPRKSTPIALTALLNTSKNRIIENIYKLIALLDSLYIFHPEKTLEEREEKKEIDTLKQGLETIVKSIATWTTSTEIPPLQKKIDQIQSIANSLTVKTEATK